MRILRKSKSKSLVFKLVFLALFLLFFGNYSHKYLFTASAFNTQINIFPDTFNTEFNEHELSWQKPSNILFQDLSFEDSFDKFSSTNSAFISFSSTKEDDTNTGEVLGAEEEFQEDVDFEDNIFDDENYLDETNQDKEDELSEDDFVVEKETSFKDETEKDEEENIEEIIEESDKEELLKESTKEESSDEPVEEVIEIGSEDIIKKEPVEVKEEKEETKDEIDEVSSIFKGFKSIFKTFELNFARAQDEAPTSIDENFINNSLLVSGFSLPVDYSRDSINQVSLKTSLAAFSNIKDDKIIFEYSFDGLDWKTIASLNIDKKIANSDKEDYFTFPVYILDEINNLSDLQIKVRYEGKILEDRGSRRTNLFIDALWIELDYEEANEDSSIEEDQSLIPASEDENIDREINALDDIKYFTKDNSPEYVFEYKKTRKGLFKKLGAGLAGIFVDEYKDIKIEANLLDAQKNKNKLKPIVTYLQNGQFEISIDDNIRQFEPGEYSIEVLVNDGNFILSYIQDFTWGVLALNINKSIFESEEVAYFQMAVLDNEGHTICDADLLLEVVSPGGEIVRLGTDNGLLKRNPLCGPDNVIDSPDYFAYYGLSAIGEYELRLTAETENGIYEITDSVEVRSNVEFAIERIGPTRIYPIADYEMNIRVSPESDFKGQFREFIPSSFKIKSLEGDSQVVQHENEKVIVWEVDWQSGGTYDLKYVFDAPDVSPEFFLLGPAQVANEKGSTIFFEARKWQIASDAVYEYDGGTSIGWINSANAWDSVDGTYAKRDIPRRNVDDSANYLEANANSVPSETYTINSVEIGIEAYAESADVSAYLVPRFSGSTSGSTQTLTGATMGTTDSGTTFYFDITNDAQAPGTWTWSDIQNLDVRIYGSNTNNGQPRELYVDQVRIQVDYSVPNDPPTGSFNSAAQKTDASGVVDVSIEIDDPDDDNVSAQIEYSAGACPFGTTADPTLSEVDGDTSADFGDPNVLNSNIYQIGNATAWIETASGTNSVLFDWDSQTDVSTGNGDYCLRLTANDGTVDQTTSAVQTVTVDNVNPTTPGALTNNSVDGTSVTLNFGAVSSDTNFDKYIIYYKEGSSGVVVTDESFTNTDMDLANYNGASTVNIPDLFPSTQYVFNIWAYDDYGNLVAAATEVTATTNAQLVPPISSVNSVAQKTDATGIVDISIEVDDGNDDDVRVRIDYESGSACTFGTPLDPTLDETSGNISADFDSVIIDNSSTYQVGTSTGWVTTASGSNSVLFDWDTKDDLTAADGIYCIQVTANDDNANQTISATSTLLIDNVSPDAPGALSLSTSTDTSVTLTFGATTTDSNFSHYKIFYKEGTSGVTESDSEHSDEDLLDLNFNGTLTTRVNDLEPETSYIFNIWAYDDYGNKASSTEVSYATQEAKPRKAKTVTYFAGINYGNGSTGDNSDTDNTFSTFNFLLGESDVEIKNAYIIFEAQFEAYTNNAGNYSGYNLAFDTCVEPCTADAFSGTNRILKDENTVLVYDETESNQIRLLYDVTSETQLAAYAGASANMEGQIGYRIERGGASNSISYASAKLVVTYVYDDSVTSNVTNTVYYPLDSDVAGHSGTRLSSQANGCTLNTDCPTFSYQMDIPEYGSSISDWFVGQIVNDHNNSTKSDDIDFDVNIETYNINSATVIHEVANAGSQSKPLSYYFGSVPGLTPNVAQSLEMHPNSSLAYNYFLMGGEVAMTYISSSTEATKTRTVSFPLGVTNNGASTALSNSSADVYFPENGASSGVVTIKDAWVRIVSSNYVAGGSSVTVSSQVGTNLQSGNYVYNYDPAPVAVNPTFDIYHIIPSSDYAELALANGVTPKTVTVNTTNSSASQAGVSAELMITYIYTDESNGYLSNINLYAGQSSENGNSQSSTSTVARIVAPEIVGTKTMLGGHLEPSYLISDSGGTVTGANASLDANISTTTPTCTNTYLTGVDSANAFSRFYKDVSSALLAVNSTQYTACYSNNGVGSGTGGAKMNGILSYTYQYAPPPPEFTQNDWRWYENIDSEIPLTSKALENTSISQVYLADTLRLRMNVAVSKEDLATSSKSFKLQFGKDADCTAVGTWTDVGDIGSGEAWEAYNNPSVSDGVSASSTLLASSTVIETYEEENPSAVVINHVAKGELAEWDWVLYDNNASSSANYCFRMVESDDTIFTNYNTDGYPKLTTSPANTAPTTPTDLGQFLDDEVTVINNQNWISENNVKLVAQATDPDVAETITLYYEVIDNTNFFTTSTSTPVGACVYGTAYESCPSYIWYVATSSPDFFRYDPYIGTTSVTAIPDGSYKWQVLSCDADGECSTWVVPGANPNFQIDTIPPTAPGSLTDISVTPTSITVGLGASTTEINFLEYKVFYKEGSSGVTELDLEYLNPSVLDYQNYNGTPSVDIGSLSAGTAYVINLWAYDKAGNSASSTIELATTTTSSFTIPTGSMVSTIQKLDGTGAVDILLQADDADNDNTLRAKIEYVAGAVCYFTTPNIATIDSRDAYTSADYGDPKVDNNLVYQVGSSTGWIWTAPGENYVAFDWLAKTDVPDVEGTYCIRSTINDGIADQSTPSTKLVLLDTVDPTAPGALTLNQKNSESIVLNFGAKTEENNFANYKIFYATTSPVSEDGDEQIDSNLLDIDFNFAATTTISGLTPGVTYYFNIWAYDNNGNNASSTELVVTTNYLPNTLVVGDQYWNDETTLITNGAWINNDDIYLSAWANDQDSSEILTIYFELIDSSGTFTTATTEPTGACVWGTDYTTCASNIWFTSTSTPGNYSVTSFYATTSITDIPDSSGGYKWQVFACDDDGGCVSDWSTYNTVIPNFKVDDTAPSPPGALVESSKNSSNITMTFGTSTDEINFTEYKIFYSTTTPVAETDAEHADTSLSFIDYNSVSITSISDLLSNTQYYINIWAYDEAGNKASSTEVAITTDPISSTPGVFFYTKNTQSLFYRYWDGSAWSTEQTGPTLGSASGDNIRHIDSIRSDDGAKILVVVKTWDGTNQEWWGTVYRYAADDFVNTSQLGSASAVATDADKLSACLGSLSESEFFVLRNNNSTNGTQVYSWNSSGWTTESNGPDPGEIMNGCRLERRPGTDNYVLMTFDNHYHRAAGHNYYGNVGSAYYYGGSTYANSWTTWTEHSGEEGELANYVGEAYFNPSDNTKGALNYSNSDTAASTKAKYFVVTNTTINYGTEATSPVTWAGAFVHGEFASNPESDGVAYYIGDDQNGEANVYEVDISTGAPVWSTPTNGDNISGSNAYSYTNNSQKPYDLVFYAADSAVALWNENTSATPKYRNLDASANSLDATDTAVPGSSAATWSRVRTGIDPNEDEFVAIYQNSTSDYSAVFWDGFNGRFYNSTDNPSSNQIWTSIATGITPSDYDDDATSFSFAKRNSAPSTPTLLVQYESDATTTIPNGDWSSTNEVYLEAAANDPDTSEVISLYIQLIANASSFELSTQEPGSACVWGTAFGSCASRIWFVASSSAGDYSVTKFSDKVSIPSVPDSATGYKWQVIACDDQAKCSNWVKYNLATPNFKVDATPPTAPGALTEQTKTSSSVILNFGAQTTELNFSEYKIFYSTTSPVSELNAEHTDANLSAINYSGASDTTIYSLEANTTYYINIWAYDLAGSRASSTQVTITTNQAPYLEQSSYIIENDDGATVNANTGASAIDTSLANINLGERFNGRLQLENTGGDVALNTTYQIQYENQTDSPGTWVNVGAETQVSYSQGLSGSNGNFISSAKAALNANTWINGSWHEGSDQTGVFTLGNGFYTEFVFALETSNALAGKTYRLRLYNLTGDKALDNYSSYLTFSTIATEIIKYSKISIASLPIASSDLTYYLDPNGYSDIASDNGVRDSITTSSEYPIYNFVTKHTNDTDAISVTWNGQSGIAGTDADVILQVYRFGSTNSWVTVSTNATSTVNTDFDITGSINSALTEHYNVSNQTFWRVYQDVASSTTFSSDYFNTSFSPADPNVKQIHYRFRNDDGSETTATWRELEDDGDPLTGIALEIGSTTRLRIEVANIGGGAASNYDYQIEYAYTTTGCSSDPGGWVTIPVGATTEEWEMAASSNFVDSDPTTAQLSNIEEYTFVAGTMVEDPSNSSGNISLIENRYTELEYSIRATVDAYTAGTYCFRVTNSGTDLDSYNIYPELTLAGISNTAPAFTVNPSDNNSATNTPTNFGEDVTFTATADDIETDDYYLAICQTDSIRSGNDGPPICRGGEWCVSDLASSTDEAFCAYTTATSTESLEWFAFVCDKYAGVGNAKCSLSSQGSGTASANDSPFVINHPPVFSAVITSDNNNDPGSSFTITSTSNDSDTLGGDDILSFYVCIGNTAGVAGCGGGPTDTICSYATTTDNVSCSFTDTAPTLQGDYTYNAFIFDSNGLASVDNFRTNTYTINNVAPVLGSLILNSGSAITLNMKGAGGTPINTVLASVTDQNGCDAGLIGASAAIYMSDVASGFNCTPNDSVCYQINPLSCSKTGCTGDDDPSASYTCSTTLEYFAAPTDDSENNPWSIYNWLSYISIYDGSSYAATSSSGVELNTTIALNVNEDIIDFGSNLFVGENSGTDNATTTIVNLGNSPIDTTLSGTDMFGNPSGTIPAKNIEWDLSNFTWSSGVDLLTIGTDVNTVTPNPINSSEISDQLFWGIGIPNGAYASVYNGQNDFSVKLDVDDWQLY
ncbi:MAG: fibronectin type III domain-containing protein [Patescibacteria group bacterium]|jgi:hypothetical protein|nr:fibronectin type III domain-containing protein [Patescibacteria group bacterium]